MTWPLLVYFAFVIVLVAAVLAVSYLLGQRHSEPATAETYEGGDVLRGLRPGSGLRICLGRSGPRSWLGRLLGSCAVYSDAGRGAAVRLESGGVGLVKETRSFEVRTACSGH